MGDFIKQPDYTEKKNFFFGTGDEISVICKDGNYVEGTINSIEIKYGKTKFFPLINMDITQKGYYPEQNALIWLDEIEKLEIINFKDEIVPNKEYEDFIQKCLQDIEGLDKRNYIFKIKRWSKEMPFWCIFFCERSNPDVSVIKEHYCLALRDTFKMTFLLSALADSGVFTKVSQRYYLKMEEASKNAY